MADSEVPRWFWEPTLAQRFFGAVLDAVILAPVSIAVSVVDGGWATPVSLLVVATYEVGMHARDGQTLGKKIMKTRVVDRTTGAAITLRQAVLRWVLFLLGTVVALVSGFDNAEALWGLVVLAPIMRPPLHEGLHDLAADTVVTSLR